MGEKKRVNLRHRKSMHKEREDKIYDKGRMKENRTKGKGEP